MQPDTIFLKDYCPSDFLIDEVYLYVDLHTEYTVVRSVLKMRRNPEVNNQAALRLDGEELSLKKVAINGVLLTPEQYQVDTDALVIAQVPQQFSIETEVHIKPHDNHALMGLFLSSGNYCTQCEAEGFRRITYYLDRPDVLARFTTTITADKDTYPVLLGNGNLKQEKTLANGRHWVCWEDPSLKPCYLFALVAGDFDLLTDSFVTMSGRHVDLRLYVEKGYGDQGDFALLSLKHAMQWDEECWGREYDLDIYMIVAVSDFNMGAMENKGLNVFNTKYILAKPETATDMDYVLIEDVIGHEYFHNWTGNRVTCRDWFQLTLKEGLTVFRDQCFIADMTSAGMIRISEVATVRDRQFVEDAGPMAHPIRPESFIEINNFYTLTVYRKGAEVIRMVQTLITSEKFRAGLDLYFERHDGQAVTTEEFLVAMEDASDHDLTQFRRWYNQAGTPQLVVESQYDEDNHTLSMVVSQSCPATPGEQSKAPFYLPLSMALIGANGQAMPTQMAGESSAQPGTRVLVIDQAKQSFQFDNVAEKPVLSLLRHFSAPVRLHYDYSLQELSWLLQHDSDPFARWNAGQQLITQVLLDIAAALQAQREPVLNPVVVDAFRWLLAAASLDCNVLSECLLLPTETYLMGYSEQQYDIGVWFAAKQFVRQQLAEQLEVEWLAMYQQQTVEQPYLYNTAAMGQRSLKNRCLGYLLATQKCEYYQLAAAQYQAADNMTDSMGALTALSHYDCVQREQCLADFYQRWQGEPLVVNKWFSLQAQSRRPDTLMQVRQLLDHPAFDVLNPNNVQALLGVFSNNLVWFHDSSGEGYRLLVAQVIAIDPQNPQLATRLVMPLTRWQGLDQQRITLMRQALAEIAEQPQLSPDLYEVIKKTFP